MRLIFILFLFLSTFKCGANPENNAYIYFDRLDGHNYSTCVIWDDHYWTCNMIEHFPGCKCYDTDIELIDRSNTFYQNGHYWTAPTGAHFEFCGCNPLE